MPRIYNNCDITVPIPVCASCNDDERGGVRGVAFIHASVIAQILADPDNGILWATLITAGKIHMIPETKGTYGATPNYVTGFGNRAQRLLDYTHLVTYDEPNTKNNCDFYNTIKRSDKYFVAFITGSQLRISDRPVQVVATSPIVEDIKQLVLWHVEITWDSEHIPCPTDIPDEVFQCNGDVAGALFPIDTGDGSVLEDGNGGVIEYA